MCSVTSLNEKDSNNFLDSELIARKFYFIKYFLLPSIKGEKL